MLSIVASAEEQPAWVPKFTKVGFKKMKIPADVYAMILWEYERKKISLEVDDDQNSNTGCPSQCNKTNRVLESHEIHIMS